MTFLACPASHMVERKREVFRIARREYGFLNRCRWSCRQRLRKWLMFVCAEPHNVWAHVVGGAESC